MVSIRKTDYCKPQNNWSRDGGFGATMVMILDFHDVVYNVVCRMFGRLYAMCKYAIGPTISSMAWPMNRTNTHSGTERDVGRHIQRGSESTQTAD